MTSNPSDAHPSQPTKDELDSLPITAPTTPRKPTPMTMFMLGTGPSSALPISGCLTDPEQKCFPCMSTLDTTNAEFQKNVRRNTGAMIQIPSADGSRPKNILIDCGKTFYNGSITLWPKLKLREIDAILLTHVHNDAALGIDDIRTWTLFKHVQETVPIYCDQATFDELSQEFPYLTKAGFSKGSGAVPELSWNLIEHNKPLNLFGVEILPIPDEAFKTIATRCQIPWASTTNSASIEEEEENTPSAAETDSLIPKPVLQAFVIDVLALQPHSSHFHIGQSIVAARKVGALRTYVTGFGDGISHNEWLSALTCFSEGLEAPTLAMIKASDPREDVTGFTSKALKLIQETEDAEGTEDKTPFYVRPAFDGLKVLVDAEKGVSDDFDLEPERSN